MIILFVLTLFSGCIEKNPIDTLSEEAHKQIDPKGDYQKDLKELDKQVLDNSGDPNAPVVSKTSAITTIENQKTFTNSIGMDFVLIPAGEFDMGSEEFEIEKPVHRVKISKGFYMGKYEVTQKQWRDVMGSDPSYFKGDRLPIEHVSWYDVRDFIKKLNEKEGGNKYRLPSEAEWEYAARAGTTSNYSFGDDESRLDDYAWYNYSNSLSTTHEVGQKKPNPWGLYDMYGNVEEWLQDTWHSDYNGAPTDGSSWEIGGIDRISRGGAWNNVAGICSSVFRNENPVEMRFSTIGFRLLKDL